MEKQFYFIFFFLVPWQSIKTSFCFHLMFYDLIKTHVLLKSFAVFINLSFHREIPQNVTDKPRQNFKPSEWIEYMDRLKLAEILL